MKIINLPTGTFQYDPQQPLGKRGGCGQVFLGQSAAGGVVAIKHLHVDPATVGYRELRIADELKGSSFEHVIPFIDSGEDAATGDYFVVMAKADRSLDSAIGNDGPRSANDAAAILLQIVKGLIEASALVHRDLKPDNLLEHDGKWKIADFGIARFVQEATVSNTLKGWLSPPYAAPEQIRGETATHATDIYSLGCIGFFILTGNPPFPANPEEGHLKSHFPTFSCGDSRLQSLISMMTRKNGETRPSASRVRVRLEEIIAKPLSSDLSGSLSALAAAGAKVADEQQRFQASQEAAKREIARRNGLVLPAQRILTDNIERLWGKINLATPVAARASPDESMILGVRLGNATLAVKMSVSELLDLGCFKNSGWDVITHGAFRIDSSPARWSESFFYARPKGKENYRWYSIGFYDASGGPRLGFPSLNQNMAMADDAIARIGQRQPYNPVPMRRNVQASPKHISIALGPWPMDDESEDAFHSRIISILANAASDELKPLKLPLDCWPPQIPN